MALEDLRSTIIRVFETSRQRAGAGYEPDRFLAFLTEPPALKGRRVADTFAGRRCFVRFMESVQLELGICFTLEEWEGGFGIEELVQLAAAKQAKPQLGLRLARQRLEESRARRIGEPVKFGLLTAPLLVIAAAVPGMILTVAVVLLWIVIVCGVAWLSIRDHGYARRLVSRLEEQGKR